MRTSECYSHRIKLGRKEVQNWGWQTPKPKQPGRMSDITCAEDTLHAWFSAVGGGREGGGIHKAYINHGPAAREAVSLENC